MCACARSFPSNEKTYFRLLELHPIALEVSFSLGTQTKFLANILPDMPAFGLFKRMLEAAGAVLASIDEAPIELGALVVHHLFESNDSLYNRIIGHYWQEVRFVWDF